MNKIALPEDFIERLHLMYGNSLVNEIIKTFVERPTTFRINTLKADKKIILENLVQLGFKVQSISWYTDAFILKNQTKRALMETPMYLGGQIYLQSLASMVPPLVLDPKSGERVLDLTAAPGSKTSQIAALMQAQGELVANDNNKIRFFKLKHNLDLLGVTEERPEWSFKLAMQHGAALAKRYPKYFDKVLLDAPCSAESRFIKGDGSTYGYWSERKVKEMAYKQRQLIFSAWSAIKPGGTLVYSTCTFAPEENEIQVARLLERYGYEASVAEAGIAGIKCLPTLIEWKGRAINQALKKCLRIQPTAEIEGFFIAKICKKLD